MDTLFRLRALNLIVSESNMTPPPWVDGEFRHDKDNRVWIWKQDQDRWLPVVNETTFQQLDTSNSHFTGMIIFEFDEDEGPESNEDRYDRAMEIL